MPSTLSQSIKRFTSAITSGPMPSPGRSSSLWVAMTGVLSCSMFRDGAAGRDARIPGCKAARFRVRALRRPGMTADRIASAVLREWQDTNAGRASVQVFPGLPQWNQRRRAPLQSPDHPSPYTHPARLILILSLAPPVGLGIGRFAYSLVLPDMRDALGWSYSAAGFMNTINAAGYLAGALVASKLIKRFGLPAAVRWATLACVLALALCALSGNFVVLSFARLLVGIGAAAVFIAGAALAATIAQSRPERANFLLSLFYAGPGLGILSSGLVAPFVLRAFGPGSWWMVWWAMTALTLVMTLPLLLAPLNSNAGIAASTPVRFAVGPALI